MTIGERIREARKKAGMKQSDLAEKLGVAVVTIGQYERGQRQPRLEQLQRIADVLEIKWYDLLPDDQKGAAIAADVIKSARLTVKAKDGNVIHQEDGRQWEKMNLAEQYRAGFLKFNSDEDRTAFFYSYLNDAGKIAAGGYFFRHIKTEDMTNVADYVLSLYENPLYKAQDAPTTPSEGTDTTSPKCPSEGTGEGTENK